MPHPSHPRFDHPSSVLYLVFWPKLKQCEGIQKPGIRLRPPSYLGIRDLYLIPLRPLHFFLETGVYPHGQLCLYFYVTAEEESSSTSMKLTTHLHTVQRLRIRRLMRFLCAIAFWNSGGRIFARGGGVRMPPMSAHDVCCMIECLNECYVVFQYWGCWLLYVVVFPKIFTQLTDFLYLFQVNVTSLSEKKWTPQPKKNSVM
jgi:hypothetical protein